MSDLILQSRTLGDNVALSDNVALDDRGVQQAGNATQQADRRRPGRMANPSLELIQLMRKPTPAARVRVALYDAPGFMLQPQARRPRAHRRSVVHNAVAITACSAMTAAMFQGMLMIWG